MKFIFTSLFLGFTLLVSAQSTLKGTVHDNSSNLIEGAMVAIPELHQETRTDANGAYSLSNLPTGTFTIVFSHSKFDPYSVSVTLSNSETIFDATLSEKHSHHLDEILVSSAFNKMQSQNVMKIEHSSIKALQQKGATTLMDGLTTIPGVSSVTTGTSIGKPVIRGLTGNRVLVYTQGVRLENQQFGEEHGLGLNDSGIESVEVIKGPASLLYGSDALGGVLYFNPEKFAPAKTYQADFGQRYFSNTLGSTTNFGLKSSSDRWKFLVRGAYNSHADYKFGDSTRVTNSRFDEVDAKIGLGYSTARFSSTLRYNVNQLNLGIPEELGDQNTHRIPDFPRQGVLGQISSLHNVVYLKKSKIEADFGYISNQRREFEDSPSPVLDMHLQTFNYDFKYYLPKMGKLETIVGVQGMRQTNTNYGIEYLIPNALTKDIGALITTNYQWDHDVLQAGIRMDSRKITTASHGDEGAEGYFEAIDKQFSSFNASLGYKTNLLENLTMRLNVASGFRAPNLAELTSNGVHEGSNRYEIGNSNLKTEQNIQTDLNIDYTNPHFEFFANGFYNHIADYIFITPTGAVLDDNFVYQYTQANASLFGGEVGIHVHPHPIDWLHFTSSFESVTGKQDNGAYLPLIPANKISNTLRGNFTLKHFLTEGYFSSTVETTFAQQKVSEFETPSNDYTLLHLSLGGKVQLAKMKFDFSLNANNVLNRTYIAHLSRLKSSGIPNIGRNIVLGLTFVI